MRNIVKATVVALLSVFAVNAYATEAPKKEHPKCETGKKWDTNSKTCK